MLAAGVGLLLLTNAARADVTRLPSSPNQDEITKAKADFANGSVVAMIDADPATFSTLLNVTLPKPQNVAQNAPLRYYFIAAHKTANGSIHKYLGPIVQAGPNQLQAALPSLNQWAAKEESLQSATPPDAQAWTELSTVTADAAPSPNGNTFQISFTVYRANSSDTEHDYYMVTQQTDSTPNFGGCSVKSDCGWLNLQRDFSISLSTTGAALIDHGPHRVTAQAARVSASEPVYLA
jgi:hypothetical protein